MAELRAPIRRTRDYVNVVRADSLVRNSLYMMTTTIVTAGLGYVFWIATARLFSSAEVGIASAVISLCSTVALLTYLGPWAALIERLHVYEGSRKWYSLLGRFCAGTAAVTAVVCAATVAVLAKSVSYGSFFHAGTAVAVAVAGAAVWTLVNLLSAAFIAARRADGLLSLQTLVSVVKVLLLVPVAALGGGAFGLVGAWALSAAAGVVAGLVWLLPRLRLGRRTPALVTHRMARNSGWPAPARRPYRTPRHRHASRGAAYPVGRLIGQHLTSAGGAATPLILPVIVVLRLGVAPNAFFYITWMVGSVFFMVSPSVSASLFAETVRSEAVRPEAVRPEAGRAGPGLRGVVWRAFRVSMLLLIPAMLVMIAGGRLVLGIFGAPYARFGYGLLVILAVSALPDAISNIAVAVLRVTGHINYAAALNIGILVVTVAGAWLLMPPLGIAGAGIAWLAAQGLGALASLPAYTNLGKKVIS